MLNARRSALYIAIIGLGFAAGEAGAACPAGYSAVSTYPAGYKVTTCVKTGSEIVQVTLETPIDGGENPFTSATLNVSLIGTSPTGNPPGPLFLQLLGPTTPLNNTKPTKPTKPPKSKQCAITVPNDDGDDDGEFDKRQVPCQIVGDPTVPPNLFGFPGGIVELTSPMDAPMNCHPNNLNCKKTVEILPTGLLCADSTPPNKPAIDFTAKPDPDNSFVLAVDIIAMRPTPPEGTESRSLTQYLGCYALTGRNYSCEEVTPLSEFDETCAGSVGNYVGTGSSPNYYCATGSLPAGDLFCGV